MNLVIFAAFPLFTLCLSFPYFAALFCFTVAAGAAVKDTICWWFCHFGVCYRYTVFRGTSFSVGVTVNLIKFQRQLTPPTVRRFVARIISLHWGSRHEVRTHALFWVI